MAATRVALISLLVAAMAVAACGGDDDAGTPPVPSASTGAIAATVPTTTPATDEPVVASTVPPVTSAGSAGTTDVVNLEAIEEVFGDVTDEQIAELGGIGCTSEVAMALLAGKVFNEDRGRDADSVDELYATGYLDELTLWEPDHAYLRPAPGSGCADVFAELICSNDAQRLSTALMRYRQTTPDAADPSQDDLVTAGLLDEPSDIVEIADGEVVAVSGGRCDGVEFDVEPQSACSADTKTLEVAYEAYLAMNGEDSTPTEADLVEAGLLREESPIMDLYGSAVVPTPGGPCEGVEGADPAVGNSPQSCRGLARTLATAYEAYRAQHGQDATPTEAELVAAELLFREIAILDLDGSEAVATPGGPCEGVELG